eukprot:SAG11_NODE_5430_length_1563_cov_1.012295_1_plen_69_part_10
MDALAPASHAANRRDHCSRQLDRWQPTDRGAAIWDASFDPTTQAAHAFFAATCADLRSRSCSAKGCMDG